MDSTTQKAIQNIELDLFKYIYSVCRENNLTVYLFFGSLLGACKYGGFIPWDDDLDIALPRPDYDKLISVLRAKPDDRYWLQTYETDDGYWQPYAKFHRLHTVFREKGTEHRDASKVGIWVDIFPLDRVKNPKSVKGRGFRINLISYYFRYRYLNYGRKEFSRRYRLWFPVLSLFSKKALIRYQSGLMTRDSCGNFYVPYASKNDVSKYVFPAELFRPAFLDFCDVNCSVPGGYATILETLYGDIRRDPPENERAGHSTGEIIVDFASE